MRAVAPSRGGSVDGDRVDLDQHVRMDHRPALDPRARRPDLAERLAVGAGDGLPLAHVGEVNARLDDVTQGQAQLFQGVRDVRIA